LVLARGKKNNFMYWANFLHIYQPPTQTPEMLLKVTNESYRKIFTGLLANPTAKLTLNINGVLTEMFANNGCEDVISQIRTLLERGQLELTASAKFHPLLPKLPETQIIRQIELNNETNRKYFGRLYQPKGFFPPEMGYDERVGKIVQKLGYKWIIIDELASPIPLDPTKTYVDSSGMHYFFRERGASFKILSAQLGTAQSLIRELADRLDKNEYMLTAMDGETFGHHRLGLEQLLLEIYQSPQIPTVFISELLELFPNTITVLPRASTWALMPRDILKNTPFSRWDDPSNQIHQKQWELTNLVLELVEREGPEEQKLVDFALHSDQYWWASAKPWWSLEMIERGAYELLTAIKSFKLATDNDRGLAWSLYIDIITMGFDWQRSGKVASLSKEEDEEINTRMTEDRPFLSQEDFKQMIDTMEKQMLTAAQDREYSRAELFRKRIEQLQTEMDKAPVDRKNEIRVNQ